MAFNSEFDEHQVTKEVYMPDNSNRIITVGRLIEYLMLFPQDLPVYSEYEPVEKVQLIRNFYDGDSGAIHIKDENYKDIVHII